MIDGVGALVRVWQPYSLPRTWNAGRPSGERSIVVSGRAPAISSMSLWVSTRSSVARRQLAHAAPLRVAAAADRQCACDVDLAVSLNERLFGITLLSFDASKAPSETL